MSHTRVMADLAALAIQSERELGAADQFSYRYARWRLKQPSIEMEQAIQEVTDILHDVLSPTVTIVQVEIGFNSCRKIGGKGERAQSLRSRLEKDLTDLGSDLKKESFGVLDVLEIDLEVKEEVVGKIGKIALAVPCRLDEPSYPTLGTSNLSRRVIGGMVADALLDSARDHFSFVLKELGVGLNDRELNSAEEWFDELGKAAKQAGLLWAVATNIEDQELFGDPVCTAVIRDRQLQNETPSSAPRIIDLSASIGGAHHIISLFLPITRTRIWLGVERKRFRREFATATPWKVFLERFSDIADSALVRLTAVIEMQKMQMETAHAQGLAAVAVTTETLFHQLVNMVRDISNPVFSIHGALLTGELRTDEDTADLIRLTHAAGGLGDSPNVVRSGSGRSNHAPFLVGRSRGRAHIGGVVFERRDGDFIIRADLRGDAEDARNLPAHRNYRAA